MERALKVLWLAILGVGVTALGGCAGSNAGLAEVVRPGLASVPAVPLSETIDSHDVIANGHDSCPRARVRVAAGDPLRFRIPACSGGESARMDLRFLAGEPAARAGSEGSESDEGRGEMWNVHLRGLPPCDQGNGDEGFALAVCRGD